MEKQKSKLTILAASDTHRTHMSHTAFIEALKPDLFIHCGDMDMFDEKTAYTFLNWAKKISKICPVVLISGNHDSYNSDYEEDIRAYIEGFDIFYLNNQSVTIKGLKIFGSPFSTTYGDNFTAFTASEENLKSFIWPKIPSDLDILITHTPPAGIFASGNGSKSLTDAILTKKPKIALCGHIHHDHGIVRENGVYFINAASLASLDKAYNPVVIEYSVENRLVLDAATSEMDVT